jgi:hypothetical protein
VVGVYAPAASWKIDQGVISLRDEDYPRGVQDGLAGQIGLDARFQGRIANLQSIPRNKIVQIQISTRPSLHISAKAIKLQDRPTPSKKGALSLS